MANHFRSSDQYEKDFVGMVDSLTGSLQKWQVWEYLITAMACSIANTTDRNRERAAEREKQYKIAIGQLGGNVDAGAKALAIVVNALEAKPDQDFLGSLYMRLELGSHWHGQFFTPYDLCELSAQMECTDELLKQGIEDHGYISIADPAVGGGAMLVAAANVIKLKGVNYQTSCLFVGQDIDRIAGLMAYIQLSLLGCPGYIVIADTLANPVVGSDIQPVEKPEQEFWYTPFYFTRVWDFRRELQAIRDMRRKACPQEEPVEITEEIRRRYTFFFDFTKPDGGWGESEGGTDDRHRKDPGSPGEGDESSEYQTA